MKLGKIVGSMSGRAWAIATLMQERNVDRLEIKPKNWGMVLNLFTEEQTMKRGMTLSQDLKKTWLNK